MLIALFVGLAVSLVQALTQIQEQTLIYVPKIVAVFGAMIVLLPSWPTRSRLHDPDRDPDRDGRLTCGRPTCPRATCGRPPCAGTRAGRPSAGMIPA